MKTTLPELISLVFLAALPLSCTKGQGPEACGPAEILSFTATAPPPGDAGRVTIDASGKTAWEAGDAIRIYWSGGSCDAVTQDCGSTAVFTTSDAVPTGKSVYCAVYPASRKATFDGSSLTVDYTQTGEPAILACSAVCTASTTTPGGPLFFANSGAMLKFATSSDKIHSATYLSSGTKVSAVAGSNSDARIPYRKGTYYIPVPGGDAPRGFSLRLKNYDGQDYPAFHRSAARTFERSHIYNVGTIEDKLFGGTGTPVSNLRVMSFNILRGDTQGPDHLWSARKDACLAMMASDAPDIVGLQECTSVQRDDILDAFPRYGAVGVSVSGLKISAYPKVSSNPILYDGEKFLLEDWGTFWLSDTPDEPGSYTWGYDKPRTCTWARLRLRCGGQRLYFFNAHVENAGGQEAKEKSILLIIERIKALNPDGSVPVIFGGDMNNVISASAPLGPMASFLVHIPSHAPVTDKGRTFNGFSATGGSALDHLFCSSAFRLKRFSVDRKAYAGITYISDHYPVYADLELNVSALADKFTVEGEPLGLF